MKLRLTSHQVRWATITPVAIAFVVVLLGTFVALQQREHEDLDQSNRHRLGELESSYQATLGQESIVLKEFVDFIVQGDSLSSAFLARDRSELNRRIQPSFTRLRDQDRVTHLSFITPQGECFLRAQMPDRFGDRIHRRTLEQAVTEQRSISGVELGKFGSLALRVVHPWVRNGEVIGYVEIGKDLDGILPIMRHALALEPAIFVQKRFLSREPWLEGQRAVGFGGQWSQFHDHVLVSGDLLRVEEPVLDQLRSSGLTDLEIHRFIVGVGNATLGGGIIPLRDAAGIRVGSLLGYWDATPLVAAHHRVWAHVLGVSGLLSLAILTFLWFYLGSVQTRLRHARSALRETIEIQQVNARSLMVNERELNREVRARRHAESELKQQLQELADARRATLNVMEDIDEARRTAVESKLEIERSMAEAERLRREAVEASKSKSEFLANMSHEIRTPMNGVLGMTELLQETELSSQQQEYLNVITTSGEALLNIINDILDFSKIEAGKMELECVEFSLHDLVEGVCDSMAVNAQSKGLELLVRIQPDVPPRTMGDSGKLRQVLINLIGNALKFTYFGEVRIDVDRIGEAEGKQKLRFSVQDTGIGIPPEREASLFDAFSQADSSTTRRFGGTGLGLTISRRIVDLMNGEIGLNSELGQGSEFWFTGEFDSVDGAAEATDPGSGRRESIERLLIATPNLSVAAWLKNRFRPYAAEIAVAVDGESVIEAASGAEDGSCPWDLLLIDSDLDGSASGEIGSWMRSLPESGRPRAILAKPISQGHNASADDESLYDVVVHKPIRIEKLLDAALCPPSAEPQETVEESTGPEDSASEFTEEVTEELSILLVDDNLVNRKVGQGMLKKFGAKATVAVNGLDAVMILERIRFDVVLMDIQMPELDGYAATLRIRDPESTVLDHDVPVIAMTANAMEGDREKCLGAGMDSYVAKPVKLDKLKEALAEVLDPDRPPRPSFDQFHHPSQVAEPVGE